MENKKNLILFIIISLGIFWGWQFLNPPQNVPIQADAQQTTEQGKAANTDTLLTKGKQIAFETDVFKGSIDSNGGDIRDLKLLKYNAADDEKQDMSLLYNNNKTENGKESVYIARTGLIDGSINDYLLKDVPFTASEPTYKMTGNKLEVKLTASKDNIVINKTYTFTKGSYLIGLKYDIQNKTDKALSLAAVYSIIRDNQAPEGETYFVRTYTGPVVFTSQDKFQKIPFKDLDKDADSGRDSAEYARASKDGWVGMIQHYFITTWLMNPSSEPAGSSDCGKNNCQIEVKKRATDGLYTVGVRAEQPVLQPGAEQSFGMSLYAGPAEYKTVHAVADRLELTKDYGKVHIFSSPLFWLLNFFHSYINNWGWAIVVLTLFVKIVLLPLTAASYRSMAKMRKVGPKLQLLKEQAGEDKARFQQEMMALYKREKINPLGGCLPMVLQIPIFIGLYWALLSSVELRQAPWIGWIHDLSRPDPYFVLPIVMSITMIVQTLYLNPPPPDPMQAKMMKIMPFVFSAMFFLFPAGLVLYYIVNNVLSMLQQWLINKKMTVDEHKHSVTAK